MPGWSSSEDENHFKLHPTDFTLTNIAYEHPVQQKGLFDSHCNTNELLRTNKNHFYNKLGFKVGMYFAGEKKLYQKRQ